MRLPILCHSICAAPEYFEKTSEAQMKKAWTSTASMGRGHSVSATTGRQTSARSGCFSDHNCIHNLSNPPVGLAAGTKRASPCAVAACTATAG